MSNHVPGWWKCPGCKRRFFVFYEATERWECAGCDKELEPILQPECGERERTPGAVLVSEVPG